MDGILITRDQLQCWAGRTLTDDDLERLTNCIPNSSIPEAIEVICDGAEIGTPDDDDDDEDEPAAHWNHHHNELGDWCPWSHCTPPAAKGDSDDQSCPAGCPSSFISQF